MSTAPEAPVAEEAPVATAYEAAEAPLADAEEDFADDPTVEDTDPDYVETGAMGVDTTDDAWGTSVWDKQGGEAPAGEAPAGEASVDEAPTDETPPDLAADASNDAPTSPLISYSTSTPDLPEAHEQTYPSPVGAPPGGERGPGVALQDAPIAQGLYGGYGEFDAAPPPTEEVPSTVMEDVGAAYNAPMNVPEPPPIPGILDRFTPPPVDRAGYTKPAAPAGPSTGLPDYLSGVEDPNASAEAPLPEPPSRRRKKAAPVVQEREEPVRDGPPLVILLVLVFVGLGLVTLLLGALWFVLFGMATSGVVSGPNEEKSPLEVREDMTREPGLIGVEPKPDEPEPDPEEPTDLPDPEAPAPEPAPVPGSEPRPRPRPRPKPRPAPAAEPAAVSVGTLKIDANRRVIIRVNGQPKGFTPQRLELPPGTYEVSAAMPGQADTEKKKTVTITSPGTTVPVDFAF